MYSLSAREPFPSAARTWLDARSPYIRPVTRRIYLQYIHTMADFLHEIKLKDIRPGTIRAFLDWRLQSAGAVRTNAEAGCLQQILKEAGLWKNLADTYRPLPVPKNKARKSLSDAEVARLLAVCGLTPKRLLAAPCLIAMMHTSMGFGELRRLRRQDVHFDEDIPYVSINGETKNDFRIRTVPLNRLALQSMRWIVERWQKLGGSEPLQFILPHHARRTTQEKTARGHKRKSPPIFTEPMGHIYRAARGILNDAGLKHIVPYDMRSQFITRISADPDCSDQMYSELAGHSPKDLEMRRRYSRQQLERKAAITDKLCAPEPSPTPDPPDPAKKPAETSRLIVFPARDSKQPA